MGGSGIGPYVSQLDSYDSDAGALTQNDGYISAIICGTATLSSGTVTVTLPNGKAFANTKYKVFVTSVGTLITTADLLQEIASSRTTNSFVIKSTTSGSSAAAATVSWMAVGQVNP